MTAHTSDLEQALRQKSIIERGVAEVIEDFCERTGLRIYDIDINVPDLRSLGGKGQYKCSVHLDIRL